MDPRHARRHTQRVVHKCGRTARQNDDGRPGPTRLIHTYIHTNIYSAKNHENESEELTSLATIDVTWRNVSKAVFTAKAGCKCVEALGRIIIRGPYSPYLPIRPVKNRVVGCWCGCLSGAWRRRLYDLHINSMTYTLFLFQIISFKKVFYASLGNIFFTVFVETP